MTNVLDERHGENASGETTIEAYGIAHHIGFCRSYPARAINQAHHGAVARGLGASGDAP
jgi:hypothetical protein